MQTRPPDSPAAETVRFPSGDGECVGDLHLPGAARPDPAPGDPPEEDIARDTGEDGGRPVVILAHGIGAERSFGLEPFARRFAARGMAALAFDYRHFGESAGEPRCLVSPARQVEDYLSAMAFVRAHPRLDGDRIALWGTSFSGGHVLVAAGRRPAGLQAVVSQIPFVSGVASTFAYPLRYHLPAILLGALDRIGALLGRDPISIPVIRPSGFALLASPDSYEGYRAIVDEDSDWPGEVPARVFLEVLTYHPGRSAPRIRVPTLLVGASQDAVCPIGATRRTARRIPDARLKEFPIGHFDAYRGDWFERIVALEVGFLARHLLGDVDGTGVTNP